MAAGILPDVEATERQLERRQAAEQIGEASGGDLAVAGLDERDVAKSKRIAELGDIEIDVGIERGVGVPIERVIEQPQPPA